MDSTMRCVFAWCEHTNTFGMFGSGKSSGAFLSSDAGTEREVIGPGEEFTELNKYRYYGPLEQQAFLHTLLVNEVERLMPLWSEWQTKHPEEFVSDAIRERKAEDAGESKGDYDDDEEEEEEGEEKEEEEEAMDICPAQAIPVQKMRKRTCSWLDTPPPKRHLGAYGEGLKWKSLAMLLIALLCDELRRPSQPWWIALTMLSIGDFGPKESLPRRLA
ncbi:uncharacterized protein BO80DRAFT_435702 [Aspergillus ibericus CBS 121593]|uniref:Uncharacterized protein n=1 Tax=Aspergillus ibericus CBS 121593 TaxID=1448316 RepID=A0A395GWW1_9EURO|nr:hypothetical protein BO80DRAFT_435702 [Aspergillus ibericus CBS 121593]RAL00027.1 hypothetical protein BO80DRAFT_435702 [Aspergillus ibericus CBS 121593]